MRGRLTCCKALQQHSSFKVSEDLELRKSRLAICLVRCPTVSYLLPSLIFWILTFFLPSFPSLCYLSLVLVPSSTLTYLPPLLSYPILSSPSSLSPLLFSLLLSLSLFLHIEFMTYSASLMDYLSLLEQRLFSEGLYEIGGQMRPTQLLGYLDAVYGERLGFHRTVLILLQRNDGGAFA